MFEGEEIIVTPGPDAKDKKVKRVKIEQGYDHVRLMKRFLDCCRTREQTYCPMDLAYPVQTAVQMSILAMRSGKTARFDPAQEKIVL